MSQARRLAAILIADIAGYSGGCLGTDVTHRGCSLLI
jgi:hypothetical protein